MIQLQEIQVIVNEIIDDKSLFPGMNIFIVDIKVSNDNLIQVFVDDINGLGIDECAKISKAIEKKINRDSEDFELLISSPGIDKPFKVIQQYLKHINKEIVVKMKDGILIKGYLLSVNDAGIIVNTKEDLKNKTMESKKNIYFNQIKETRSIITF
jgi:ribosome maturation factor RimP